MEDLRRRLGKAVQYFWTVRLKQDSKQGSASGKRDTGNRTAVTGGSHCNGFANLFREILVSDGIKDAHIFHKRQSPELEGVKAAVEAKKGTQLPGYFRPTKDWDLVVVAYSELIASIEFKSQVGSFGNNFNNRTEEALGNATDLWTAYREGAFKPSSRPWLGFFMLLEDVEAARKPVKIQEPHFKVFPEFVGASYQRRYEILCERLVRERLYDAACLIMSSKDAGLQGIYREPNPEFSFEKFAASLSARAISVIRMQSSLKQPRSSAPRRRLGRG